MIDTDTFKQVFLSVYPNGVFQHNVCWSSVISDDAYKEEGGRLVANLTIDGECQIFGEHGELKGHTSEPDEFKILLEQFI